MAVFSERERAEEAQRKRICAYFSCPQRPSILPTLLYEYARRSSVMLALRVRRRQHVALCSTASRYASGKKI